MKGKVFVWAVIATSLLSMLVDSCVFWENALSLSRPRVQTGGTGTSGKHQIDPKGADTVVFVSAVEFSKSYHWQRDTSGEAEHCNVVLFADGVRVLDIPAGQGTMISREADMVRVCDGHLYTDYSLPDCTVICKDGREIFRYDGRETIRGFLVNEKGVYTLGQNRSGDGFSYRLNGEVLYSSDSGEVIGTESNSSYPGGALYEDSGYQYFSYTKILDSPTGRYVACWNVQDGVAAQLNLDINIANVLDVRVISGVIHVAAELSQPNMSPVLYIGDRAISMAMTGYGCRIGNSRIMNSEGFVCLKTDFTFDRWKTVGSALLLQNGEQYVSRQGERAVDYYADKQGYAYVSVPGADCLAKIIRSEYGSRRDVQTTGGRYSMMSGRCATLFDNVFYVGLSPCDQGGYPILYKDSQVDTIRINGYITSVRVEVIPPQE